MFDVKYQYSIGLHFLIKKNSLHYKANNSNKIIQCVDIKLTYI